LQFYQASNALNGGKNSPDWKKVQKKMVEGFFPNSGAEPQHLSTLYNEKHL
jgi:hypothetical protein